MRHTIRYALLALLTGCAGSPGMPAVAPDGEPIRIVIRSKGADHTSISADSKGEPTRRGAKSGALGGATTGGAVSLGCGTFAPICAVFTVPAGMLVGALGGAFIGHAELTKDQTERVNAALRDLDARRDVRTELVAALERELPPDLQSVADCAECTNVSVSIISLSLKQHNGKQLSLRLWAAMRVEGKYAHSGEMFLRQFNHECESKQRDVRTWLVEGGTAFDEAMTTCIDDSARRMREILRKTLRR